MKGFFNLKEVVPKGKKIKVTDDMDFGCSLCGLEEGCRSPRMGVTGEGRLGVLIIAEAPGELEDYKGVQLVGPAGQCLRRTLGKIGVDLDRDCWKINAVNCRPPENATPNEIQYRSCQVEMVSKTIEKLSPSVVVLLGGTALNQWLKSIKWSEKGSIGVFRGYTIPDSLRDMWVCPTLHPSYVMRQGFGRNGKPNPENVAEVIWQQDLERAFGMADTDIPDHLSLYQCKTKNEGESWEILDYLATTNDKYPIISFDYETTGLKPQRRGHRIVSCSVCYNPEVSFAFEMTSSIHKHVVRFLQSKHPKTAHNMKFEDIWSNVILETPVNNWAWDTCIAAHILDNRAGTKRLDFQGLVHFGVSDYCSEISPFLKGVDEKDANSFNRINEIPINKLLKYNAMDSLIGYNLALKQMSMIGAQ